MRFKAVIWDMGGVILRTGDYTSRHGLAARIGVTPETLENLVFSSQTAALAATGEIDIRQHWLAVCEALQRPPEESLSIRDEFFAGDLVDAELLAFIQSLRPRYKTALLSNAWTDMREIILKTPGFTDAFDEIVLSAEIGMVKPDARIYEFVLSRLGIAPQEAVFVDDFAVNIEGARSAGLAAIQFLNTGQIRRDLQAILVD